MLFQVEFGSYLYGGIDFLGIVAPSNSRPHVLHDLRPPPPVDEDDVPKTRKGLLILLVQPRQLSGLGLIRALLEVGLLRGRLRRLDLLLAEPRVGSEDGEQGRVR